MLHLHCWRKPCLRAGSGDVKYHLGTSYDRPTKVGTTIHLSLLANPSHLEAVNTVVLGKCRARQFYEDDESRRGTMPILLHGDGAFSGQVRNAPGPPPPPPPPLPSDSRQARVALCGSEATCVLNMRRRAAGHRL